MPLLMRRGQASHQVGKANLLSDGWEVGHPCLRYRLVSRRDPLARRARLTLRLTKEGDLIRTVPSG
jgi:hypothetical protein